MLALNIDLAPTIADAAGVAHPPTDGRSLLPLLGGEPVSTRSDFLIEHMEGTNPIPTFCAVRSERWTYVRYSTGEEELYDLAPDPFELENVGRRPSMRPVLEERRARLRDALLAGAAGLRGSDPGPASRSRRRCWAALVLVEALASRRRAGLEERAR